MKIPISTISPTTERPFCAAITGHLQRDSSGSHRRSPPINVLGSQTLSASDFMFKREHQEYAGDRNSLEHENYRGHRMADERDREFFMHLFPDHRLQCAEVRLDAEQLLAVFRPCGVHDHSIRN